MASLRGARRGLVLAAAAAALAGCMGMPSSGTVGISTSPQTTAPAEDFIGPIPVGPDPSWGPAQIVSGFLAASASYPTFSEVTKQYLVSSAARRWDPGWRVTVFSALDGPNGVAMTHHGQQATVDVTGTAQATFNGSGEFVSTAQKPRHPANTYPFDLVKVNGMWRIANPPQTRLLTQAQFSEYYKPQDLYFVNPIGENWVLVPDSVFVPLGTSPTALVTNLVMALLQGPKGTWLQDATSSFPAGTALVNVAVDGTTAVVNLGGAAARLGTAALEQISAQLLWTLATPQPGAPQPIQSVELEVNGEAFVPPGAICGTSQSQSPVQKQASYACYAPYPASQASFSFIEDGTAWSRCGLQQQVAAGSIGAVVSVLGHADHVLGVQACQGNGIVGISDQEVPPGQPRLTGTPAGLAVSPDGQYAAYVSAGKGADTLYIRPVGNGAGPVKAVRQPGVVTSLCWDTADDLWYVEDGTVWVASAAGDVVPAIYQGTGNGNIIGVRVAPDGARIALIVQAGSQRQIQLAAISRNGQSSTAQRGSSTVRIGIGQGVQLAPDLTDPVALTWYDADNLLVLAATGSQNSLYEVPADGQPSTQEPLTPPGATSITAYGPGNALVIGLSDGKLSVSASLQGPWQTLGGLGRDPAYPG